MTHSRTILLLIALAAILAGCHPAPTPSPAPTPTTGEQPYHIQVEMNEGEPAMEFLGPSFSIFTDNCGAATTTTEVFTRSLSFTTEASLTITEDVRASVGGGIPGALQADLQAGLEHQLGVRIGAAETQTAERTIITPPNSSSRTTLQWQELWTLGTIHILTPDGELLGDVPFRLLATLHLAQIGVEIDSCPMNGEEPEETVPLAIEQGLPGALDCLGEHLLNPAVPALCPAYWINTGANAETLTGYILDRQIASVFNSVNNVQWTSPAITDVVFDEELSTPQAAVYSLRLESELHITGNLRCSSREEAVYDTYIIPFHGRARVEILHPEDVDEMLRVYSWVIEDPPLRTLCPAGEAP